MGCVLTSTTPVRPFGKRARAAKMATPGWKIAGVLALLCSGVAWASLPRIGAAPKDDQRQWQALGISPLSSGGATGMRMEASDAVEPLTFVPKRAVAAEVKAPEAPKAAIVSNNPLRIRGRVGDGLYWSLRAAGASPQVAAQYLAAVATQ